LAETKGWFPVLKQDCVGSDQVGSSLPFLHAEVVLKGANVLMYADDVTVFIQDQQQVQTLVKG